MQYKKIFFLGACLPLLASCMLQRSAKGRTDYQHGMQLYEAKKYYEANQAFAKALPTLRGEVEEAEVHFCQAYCSFYQRKYTHSAERFGYFYETFPRETRREEALYMQGRALYLESPPVELGQSKTEKAVQVLSQYTASYPEGAYSDQSASMLEELKDRLALKAFNNAQLYHQIGHYAAAVVALAYFQVRFADTAYSQKAAYLKAEAQYRLASGKDKAAKKSKRDSATAEKGKKDSTLAKDDQATQRVQWMNTIRYCQEFLDTYPSSEYTAAVEKIYEKSLSYVDKLTATSTPSL